jgi:phenylalanine-4-hydroxylase
MDAKSLIAAAPYLIEQRCKDYSAEEHDVWRTLVGRRRSQLEAHACREYLSGYELIGLEDDRLPDLAAVSDRLMSRTGWRSTPVSGFLPAEAFFEMLAARMFPTTTWLRSRNSLEYTPEPDIFHDVFGHVPMHAHPVFADFLESYGRACAQIQSAEALELLGRLFWYTVEFGLIRERGKIKVYGSGVISSHSECTNVIQGGCEIRDFDLLDVLATPVKIDQIHSVLFVVESFDQVYEAMHEAEKFVLESC